MPPTSGLPTGGYPKDTLVEVEVEARLVHQSGDTGASPPRHSRSSLLPPLFATADTPADRSIREAFALLQRRYRPRASRRRSSFSRRSASIDLTLIRRLITPPATRRRQGCVGHRHRAQDRRGFRWRNPPAPCRCFQGRPGWTGDAASLRRCGPSCAGQPTPNHSKTSGNSSQYSANGGRSGS